MAQRPIFFLSYLIVTAIQMGANIDYAIVISSWYNELKAEMSRREAIVQALNLSFPTVLTSGSILSSAGFLIAQITTEPAIVGIGECLSRGLPLRGNGLAVDLDRANGLAPYVQCYAVWLPDELRGEAAFRHFVTPPACWTGK